MASTDAFPVPRKNVAYRVTFPVLDADGDKVTSGTGMDSTISKDGGTFAACTNEATEIATTSGIYYLDLTSTEMNADTVAVSVHLTNTGAKDTVIVMYPEEIGDYRVNVSQFGGTTVTGRDIGASVLLSTGTGTGQLDFTSGVVKGNVTQWLGTAVGAGTAGVPNVDVTHIANAAVSTSTAQLGVNLVNIAGSAVSTSTAQLGVNAVNAGGTAWGSGAITAGSIAADAIGASELATDAVTEIVNAVLAGIIEGSITLQGAQRLQLAALAGKLSGAATTTVHIRDTGDSKDRILATVDADGNRSAVTLDAT